MGVKHGLYEKILKYNYSLRDEVHASKSWMYQMGSEEEVLKELKVEPILDYICRYQNNWREHANRMSRTSVPKAVMYYQPRGKR
jgi:hypothetical protein